MTPDNTRELIAEAREIGSDYKGWDCDGSASICDRRLKLIDRLAVLSAPQEGDARSPWTRHGHLIPGRTADENRPPVARCGGPKLCRQCDTNTGGAHAAVISGATQEGDAREVISCVLADHTITTAVNDGAECECGEWSGPWSANAPEKHQADAILAAFPVLSLDIAGEIEAEREDTDFDALGADAYINGLIRAAEIVRNGR